MTIVEYLSENINSQFARNDFGYEMESLFHSRHSMLDNGADGGCYFRLVVDVARVLSREGLQVSLRRDERSDTMRCFEATIIVGLYRCDVW